MSDYATEIFILREPWKTHLGSLIKPLEESMKKYFYPLETVIAIQVNWSFQFLDVQWTDATHKTPWELLRNY